MEMIMKAYVDRRPKCQQKTVSSLSPTSLLQSLPIPNKK